MGEYFSHHEIFPVIARSIRVIYEERQDYVTQPELIEHLLALPNIQRVVADAQRRGGQTKEYWVANMIAWFGQRITVGTSSYEREFNRKKVAGRWAYRPAGGLGPAQ